MATRALHLLARWAFDELRLRRIQALVHPRNRSSARALERLGFEREGLLRAYRDEGEGPEDRIMFSALPAELREPVETPRHA